MPKFIKKPVIVDANQFDGENGAELIGVCEMPCIGIKGPHVHTIHKGQMCLLEKGDWILPEPDGEHYYPVKDKIFRDTYEPLDESSAP